VSAQDLVLVISAVQRGLLSIIAAIFAGWIAVKQMPRQAAKVEEVHALVNANSSEQKAKIEQLEGTIGVMRDDLLAAAHKEADMLRKEKE